MENLLVPLVYSMVVDENRFNLHCTKETVVLYCAIVNVEYYDGFFRCHITKQVLFSTTTRKKRKQTMKLHVSIQDCELKVVQIGCYLNWRWLSDGWGELPQKMKDDEMTKSTMMS